MDSSSLSNLGFLFVLAFVERDCLVRERFSVDDDLDRRDLLVSEILVRVSSTSQYLPLPFSSLPRAC
ncbi:hypothetical protein WALSEDRAFT_33597 [Wallemia mellicola CBS 633.66]|uniref:Uncharacterized protein n=1 Tax=Wallemia mellicola (strain ATCC MYA-4683 / CBS 633.66) TaxID=671144 RepID=I4Y868_WALMC|nr:hypothetical protein WALSEDRAFT_33597 [Wallemia mellicola CBS 633.66]EIM20160.1 hypothetical protein WALSEDRAFT_33597 [Wallemia mellicola CBS 633.66]|eukprot:XP_006959881.1 hypothetical protein WALSEDRAFT_33597 [Wallemia mellicola CBS 633.66]